MNGSHRMRADQRVICTKRDCDTGKALRNRYNLDSRHAVVHQLRLTSKPPEAIMLARGNQREVTGGRT